LCFRAALARFYFEPYDGRLGVADKIGFELPGFESGQQEAVRAPSEIAKKRLA
jgi:hypothetical protein